MADHVPRKPLSSDHGTRPAPATAVLLLHEPQCCANDINECQKSTGTGRWPDQVFRTPVRRYHVPKVLDLTTTGNLA